MLSLPLPVRIFHCTRHADLRKSSTAWPKWFAVREFLAPIRCQAICLTSVTSGPIGSSCSTGTAMVSRSGRWP